MAEVNGIVGKIQSYLQSHPEMKKLSEKEVLSIMVENNAITRAELAEAQKTSAFAKATGVSKTNMAGLEVERHSSYRTYSTRNYSTYSQTPSLTREEAQCAVIDDLSSSLQSAFLIMMRQDNGAVTGVYDSLKEYFDSELSEKNVGEVIDNQMKCVEYLQKSKDLSLTKKEYYIENRERLKDMMIKRLYQKDEKSGLDFLDRMKGEMSKEELGKFLEDYINKTVDELSQLSTAGFPDGAINAIKNMQHTLMTQNAEQQNEMLEKLLDGAQKAQADSLNVEGANMKVQIPAVPPAYNNDDKMTFEETFKLERGIEFSQEAMTTYVQKKAEFTVATAAYNKYQQFEVAADKISENAKDKQSFELADEIFELFENYYANSPEENAGKNNLEKLIKKYNLPIDITQNFEGEFELDLRAFQNEEQRNKALLQLLKLGKQEQKSTLERVLGGKDISYYADNYQLASDMALGSEDAEELTAAMEKDNMEAIQTYSTGAMVGGVALSAVGKLLTFTPLAPAGIIMFAAGNVSMAGAMIAKNSLGFTEALTRNSVNTEELKGLSKGLLMDLGGLVIGYNAGKLGAQIKASMLKSGSGALNAIIAEKGTDFGLSLAGDLAMMGILHTNDSAESLTVGNLMGTAVSTILGIKAGKMSTPETKQTLEMLVRGGTETVSARTTPIQNPELAQNIADNMSLTDLDKQIIATLKDGEHHVIVTSDGNEVSVIKNGDNYDIEVRDAKSAGIEMGAKYGEYGYNPYEVRKGRMQPGASYTLNCDNFPAIQLPGGQVIDLNSPEYMKAILSLKEGQHFTIGRKGDFHVNDPSGSVSRNHLVIFKQNGQLKIQDISKNGSVIVSDASIVAQARLAQGNMIKNQAYEISENSLPEINLANQEKINLKNYKTQIENLQEGQVLTIGREGDIKTSDNSMISRQHLIIYRSNGKLKIKDVSANGARIEENGFLDRIKNKLNNILNNFNNRVEGNVQFTQQEINLLNAFRNNPIVNSVLSDPKAAKNLVKKINKILSDRSITPPEVKSALETGYATMRGSGTIKCTPDDNILNDIVKLASGEDYIKHFDSRTSISEVYANTPVGEVANWNGQLYVNNGKGLQKINLSEKRFRKLFPPVKRFATHQGSVGTCYLVSSLERLYSSPRGRAEIYNLIGEDSEGIYTKTYNGQGYKQYFKRFDSKYKHIQEETGLAIIEQGFCKNSVRDAQHFNARETIIMQVNEGGWSQEAIYGLIGKKPTLTYDENTMRNYIMNYANNENIIMNFGTINPNGLTDLNALSREYNLFAQHEYSIKGYDRYTDSVIISNPWHSDVTVSVPMSEFLKYADEVTVLGL